MKHFEFDIVVTSPTGFPDESINALFEAGIDDGTPLVRDGILTIMFDRRAATLEKAILSALKDIQESGLDVKVLRVEFGEPAIVSAAEIAKRIGKSREMVRLYANGLRGPGGFPAPVAPGTWDWADVAKWLRENKLYESTISPDDLMTANAINSVLTARRQIRSRKRLLDLWSKVPS